MRYISLFLLLMIAAAALILPYGDGYLLKQNFMNIIAQIDVMQKNQHASQHIKVTNYQVGWLNSHATVTVSTQDDSGKAIESSINLVIHHGPVVLINNKPVFALGYIYGETQLPREMPLAKYLHTNMTALLPMDDKDITVKFNIDPVAESGIKWDGLTGESKIVRNNNLITQIISNITIGMITGNLDGPMGMKLDFKLDPMQNMINFRKETGNDFNSVYTIKAGKFQLAVGGYNYLTMQSSNFDTLAAVKSGMFNTQVGGSFSNIQINPSLVAQVFTAIPLVHYSFNLDNLNQDNILKLGKMLNEQHRNHQIMNPQAVSDAFIAILSDKSSLTSELTIETASGKSALQLLLTLPKKVNSLDDLKNIVDVKAELHVDKLVLNEIVKQYLSTMASAQMITAGAPHVDDTNYYQAIANMVKSGEINADQSVGLMDLPRYHPADVAALDGMLDKLFLSETVKPKVHDLYVSIYLTNSAAAMPSSPSIIDPQTHIALWIQEGILKDDGNSYSLIVEKKGDEIKVNGSTDNPAVTNMKTMLNGAPPIPVSTTTPSTEPLSPGEIALARVADHQQIDETLTLIKNVSAAMDNKTNLSNNSFYTPWGTAIKFEMINASSYKISFPATPENVCKQIAERIGSSSKFINVTPASACSGKSTTFSYVYDLNKG